MQFYTEKKKPKKPKSYSKECNLKCLVNGFDDLSAMREGTIKNVEAGAWIHGMLVVRVPYIPPNPVALAKIVLQARYKMPHNHITYHTNDEGAEYTKVHREVKKKKWMKEKNKLALNPLGGEIAPDADGRFTLCYPFSYLVNHHNCDSFSRHDYGCRYYLKVKMKFKDCDLKIKSSKRDIDVMARRPLVDELWKKQPAISDKHKSLAGGNVKVTVNVDGVCFLEGSQVIFTAQIENNMDRPLMKGTIELEEVITNTTYHTCERGSKRYTKDSTGRDLARSRLRALEIPGKSEKTLQFALELPKIVEPPSTGFHTGDHCCKVNHFLRFHLDVPWGFDVDIRFPVKIAVDPRRYIVSPPFEQLMATLPVEAAQFGPPAGYATNAPEPSVSAPWEYEGPRMLVVKLVGARDLPKMDYTFGGLRGGADPYVTTFVNETAVRCSRYIDNTQNPDFNETYKINLQTCDPGDKPIKFDFISYDHDRGNKDDKIGDGTLFWDPAETPPGDTIYSIPLKIEHKKKGTLDRGHILFQVLHFGPLVE
mmetsp:Transcript_15614/g.25553  ORF Transcript_15614/g.25553 Transcript_15614/m.25553 type:complete len:536 (+) Transcript_15614:40-1647(+)